MYKNKSFLISVLQYGVTQKAVLLFYYLYYIICNLCCNKHQQIIKAFAAHYKPGYRSQYNPITAGSTNDESWFDYLQKHKTSIFLTALLTTN